MPTRQKLKLALDLSLSRFGLQHTDTVKPVWVLHRLPPSAEGLSSTQGHIHVVQKSAGGRASTSVIKRKLLWRSQRDARRP